MTAKVDILNRSSAAHAKRQNASKCTANVLLDEDSVRPNVNASSASTELIHRFEGKL
jgi:hypothetical protein